MSLVRKAYNASTETLSDLRQVKVICSTADIDRAGEVVVQAGVDVSAYMATGAGPVLWNHDTNVVIAKCVEIGLVDGKLQALVQFPPEGEDAQSDLYYGKIKFGSVSGVSIGFAPGDMEPLDKANPKKGPQKYLTSELMEFSFTPVQANRGSIVVARALSQQPSVLKVGASRNLPIAKAFPADDAGESILAHADFDSDSPDVAFARKGFLAYDSANPDDSASYRLPFAKMVDGRMTVCKSLIAAARAELKTADFPEDVATKAAAVLDHYEAKMTKSAASTVLKAGAEIKIKGLWQVAQLANILEDLAWLKDCVEWEAAYEEDGSAMPATLGGILVELGNALVAMASEEVAELLKIEAPESTEAVEKGICSKDAAPIVRAVVAARMKAGRMFSASNISTMEEACKAIREGHDKLTDMMGQGSTDTDETEKKAEADRVKAEQSSREKRLREVEVLRLSMPL